MLWLVPSRCDSGRPSIFGGAGFILQRLSGSGQAFVEMTGDVVEIDLSPGDELRVHPGHVALFESTVAVDLTTVPGIKNKIFGGDGLFLARLSGTGRVWLQSITPSRRCDTVESSAKPKSSSCNVGGTIKETASRLSRLI